MKLYFQLFLKLGLSYGLIMGALLGMDRGWREGLTQGAIGGLIFGTAMAFVLSWLQRRQVRKLGLSGEENLSPWQEMELDILGSSLQAVYGRVKEAVKNFGANVQKEDMKNGFLQARVKASWQSFGEIMEVRVEHLEDTRYSVHIYSRPRLRSTIIDYGKGRQNVRAIAHWLSMG